MKGSRKLGDGEAGFACLQCGAKFATLQALGGHKSIHNGKRKAPSSRANPSPRSPLRPSSPLAPRAPAPQEPLAKRLRVTPEAADVSRQAAALQAWRHGLNCHTGLSHGLLMSASLFPLAFTPSGQWESVPSAAPVPSTTSSLNSRPLPGAYQTAPGSVTGTGTSARGLLPAEVSTHFAAVSSHVPASASMPWADVSSTREGLVSRRSQRAAEAAETIPFGMSCATQPGTPELQPDVSPSHLGLQGSAGPFLEAAAKRLAGLGTRAATKTPSLLDLELNLLRSTQIRRGPHDGFRAGAATALPGRRVWSRQRPASLSLPLSPVLAANNLKALGQSSSLLPSPAGSFADESGSATSAEEGGVTRTPDSPSQQTLSLELNGSEERTRSASIVTHKSLLTYHVCAVHSASKSHPKDDLNLTLRLSLPGF